MRRNRGRRRVGMTVMEVTVALLLGGVAVSVAASMLSAVALAGERTAAAIRRHETRAIGLELARATLASAERGAATAVAFQGVSNMAQWQGWCPGMAGDLEARAVRLMASTRGDADTMTLTCGPITAVVFTGRQVRLAFYDAGEPSRWHETWGENLRFPDAIGLIADRDTIVLRVGAVR